MEGEAQCSSAGESPGLPAAAVCPFVGANDDRVRTCEAPTFTPSKPAVDDSTTMDGWRDQTCKRHIHE